MKLGDAITPEQALAEAAIEAVADWSGSSIAYSDRTTPVMSPMHKNVDSLCFAVDVDETPYFLKLTHEDVRPEIDLAGVFAAATSAASLGVAPKPVHLLPDHHALVFDRLGDDWRTAMTDDLRTHAVMMPVLAAKRRIHAGPRLARSWSIFDGIRNVSLETLKGAPIEMAELLWMVDGVHDIEGAFDAGGFDIAPCHADGLASNVMIGPDGAARLVDFDMACNTDPIYDLAITLNEAYAFEEDMLPALEAFEGSVRPATLNRCRLYAIADDLYWALWSSRMNVTSKRSGIEFLKYAQWRFLRCRMALQDPDFERKLRMI